MPHSCDVWESSNGDELHDPAFCRAIGMTAVLGISAWYHDSAAALIIDGEIVAAAQEERFTRLKHDASFPKHAVEYCLQEGRLHASDVDYVVYYEKPLLKFERLAESWLAAAPEGFRAFLAAAPEWIRKKLFTQRELRKAFHGEWRGRFAYCEHHESHAASAFFPSPFHDAAILTVDGVGEWATATIGCGVGNQIEILQELHYPHSPGLLYSVFTAFCGFRVNSGEYKLMGLAPYGRAVYSELILNEIVHLRDDGSFQLELSAFNFWRGLTMPSRRFEKLFGGPARVPESELTQRELDLAASIQSVMETILLRMGRHARTITGLPNLCLAGGVALNCSATGKLMQQQIFDQCWIQPAAGDAGGALGCALSVWYQLLRNTRCAPCGESNAGGWDTSSGLHRGALQDADCESDEARQSPVHSSAPAFSVLPDFQKGSLLGPRFDRENILQFLNEIGASFRDVPSEEALCLQVAELLRDGRLVGWFHGRMEFGPRALGARSILGDPRDVSMKERINSVTKRRESFRPFAPAILEERASDFFDVTGHCAGPYMTSVARVLDRHRTAESLQSTETGLRSGLIPQTTFPAVTHVDLTCRVQTVDRQRHPRFHRLLTCFESLTGIPMLINTSFNVRGMPIVCTPQDAYACFLETDLDVLVLEDFILLRKEQKPAKTTDAAVLDCIVKSTNEL